MKTAKMPKVALCDMDGTLADSMPLLYRLYCEFMQSHGLNPTSEEFQELVGPPIPQVLVQLRERYQWKEEPHALLHRYSLLMNQLYAEAVCLMPGALAFIEKAHEQYGMRFYLVTSASKAISRDFLKKQKIDRYFEDIICAEDVYRGKPDPEPYRLALQRAGIDANDAIAVEDSASGVASASGAGITTFWLGEGVSSNQDSLVQRVDSWSTIEKRVFGEESIK